MKERHKFIDPLLAKWLLSTGIREAREIEKGGRAQKTASGSC